MMHFDLFYATSDNLAGAPFVVFTCLEFADIATMYCVSGYCDASSFAGLILCTLRCLLRLLSSK